MPMGLNQDVGRIGPPGAPPRGPIQTQYARVSGDTAIRAEVNHLIALGESARQIVIHLTDHAQYPQGEIITMLTSIQTLLPRQHLLPSQAVVLPMNRLLDPPAIRYVTTLLNSTKYGANIGAITQIFVAYNYPPTVSAIIDAQIAILTNPPHWNGIHDIWEVGSVIALSDRFKVVARSDTDLKMGLPVDSSKLLDSSTGLLRDRHGL